MDSLTEILYLICGVIIIIVLVKYIHTKSDYDNSSKKINMQKNYTYLPQVQNEIITEIPLNPYSYSTLDFNYDPIYNPIYNPIYYPSYWYDSRYGRSYNHVRNHHGYSRHSNHNSHGKHH